MIFVYDNLLYLFIHVMFYVVFRIHHRLTIHLHQQLYMCEEIKVAGAKPCFFRMFDLEVVKSRKSVVFSDFLRTFQELISVINQYIMTQI